MKKFLCVLLSLLIVFSVAVFSVGCKKDKRPTRPEPDGKYADDGNLIIDDNV